MFEEFSFCFGSIEGILIGEFLGSIVLAMKLFLLMLFLVLLFSEDESILIKLFDRFCY
jgi:hypothetical protein